MSTKDTGGSAFPNTATVIGPNFDPFKGVNLELGQTNQYIDMGMSLRDYFAAKAMQTIVGLSPGGHFSPSEKVGEYMARKSYQIADAMLAERAK